VCVARAVSTAHAGDAWRWQAVHAGGSLTCARRRAARRGVLAQPHTHAHAPTLTTGQLFLHSCRHFLGLHLHTARAHGGMVGAPAADAQPLLGALGDCRQHAPHAGQHCTHLSSLTMAIRVSVSSGSLSFFLGGCRARGGGRQASSSSSRTAGVHEGGACLEHPVQPSAACVTL
jgi:hypothetical protein